MIASVLIAVVSVVLLGYWFRYTCILLLRTHGERPSVIEEGKTDVLRQVLERDYRMLTYLSRHGAGLGDSSVEERILIFDFKVMRLWYRFTRSAAPNQARNALAEMAAVVAFLGQRLGEQAGLNPQ
ncbi:MAG TPA: hypothetical protein VH640_18895 [Bryobacteraceae bacterium]|jgi:hypothetical protein